MLFDERPVKPYILYDGHNIKDYYIESVFLIDILNNLEMSNDSIMSQFPRYLSMKYTPK